jgi:hypothetical protein
MPPFFQQNRKEEKATETESTSLLLRVAFVIMFAELMVPILQGLMISEIRNKA